MAKIELKLDNLIASVTSSDANAQEAKEAAEAARDGVLSSPPSWEA